MNAAQEQRFHQLRLMLTHIRAMVYTGSKGLILPLIHPWYEDRVGLYYILRTLRQLRLQYAGGDHGPFEEYFEATRNSRFHPVYGLPAYRIVKPPHSDQCSCGYRPITANFYMRFQDTLFILGSCCARYLILKQLGGVDRPDFPFSPETQAIRVSLLEGQMRQNTEPDFYYLHLKRANQELLERLQNQLSLIPFLQPNMNAVRRIHQLAPAFLVKRKTKPIRKDPKQRTIDSLWPSIQSSQSSQ